MLVHGDLFLEPVSGTAKCEFPQGSGKHINFASSLWMSGYDGAGQLHISAQTYRQRGNDYWPGPLDAADTLTYATSQNWAKIWKINRSDIEYFQSLSTHTTVNTPLTILTWPAKGNMYATGNGATPLTITDDMAPFIDLNGNGIYEPLLGEYPDVPGDQVLWRVFSDNGPTHTETNGKPLGIEIQSMAYAYNRGTLIDNVIYYDYKIINRSHNDYDSVRIGLWDDVDVGWYYDDFVGFDSSHRMGIGYNGTTDDGALAGHPTNSYGTQMPMVGITMIVLPGDIGTSYIPAGGFYFINNDASVAGNPSTDTQYNYYLRGRLLTGMSIYDGMSGLPQCENHDSNHFYCYTGPPQGLGSCSECALNNTPADRRFIITTNNLNLPAGNSQHIVMALVTTDLDSNNACRSASNFDSINTVADTAWAVYYNPPGPNTTKNVRSTPVINIFPNPANDVLYIENTSTTPGEEHIAIYNSLGQKTYVPIQQKGSVDIVDVSGLPSAMYYIVYIKGSSQKTEKFIKR